MKIATNILYGFAALVLLFFLVAIFLPSTYQVERSIRIERPPEAVYRKVARLQEWDRWNPWPQQMDSNIFRGAKTGKGAVWDWQSEKQGSGKLRIVKAEPYRMLETRIFQKDSTVTGKGIWRFERKGAKTLVTWSKSGSLGYPVARYMTFFVEDLTGSDLKMGLENLKKHLEENLRLNASLDSEQKPPMACRTSPL